MYLYFTSRGAFILGIHGRLYDRMVKKLVTDVFELSGIEEFFCAFAHHYDDDMVFFLVESCG